VHLKKLHRAEGGAKFFGVFRVKNHNFMPKNHIFFNCRGRKFASCPLSLGNNSVHTNQNKGDDPTLELEKPQKFSRLPLQLKKI
jgi:hypothetical protein